MIDGSSRAGAWVVFTVLVGVGAPAGAQTDSEPRPAPKWSLEFHVGPVLGPGPGSGTAGVFPAGDPFATDTDILRPTRAVPSWFFGDGAVLFNQVNAQFASLFGESFPQIVPLDGMLTSAALRREPGMSFGGRLGRQLSPRFGLEFGFGRSSSRWVLRDSAAEAVEATRASFTAGFTGLLTLTPHSNMQVSTAREPSEGTLHQTSVTGALTVQFSPRGRLTPRALVGAGRIFNGGSTPEVRLRGTYSFRFLDAYNFREEDVVTVRFADRDNATVAVLGGGFTLDLAPRRAVRVDVRAHVRPGGLTTRVDARPIIVTGNPSLTLPSSTSPSIQFSSTGAVRSSLNGSLVNLTTFTADGLDARFHLSVGYLFRF